MIFDRGPEFRRPRAGPYRQTRTSRVLEALFVLIAKGTLWIGILLALIFSVLTEGMGLEVLPVKRKGWTNLLVVLIVVAAAATAVFLYVTLRATTEMP
jgi:hypothetical protein